MKYIKTYEYQSHIMSDEELNNIKEYVVVKEKSQPHSIFILRVFNKTKDYMEEIQLYHIDTTISNNLIDDTINPNITKTPYRFYGILDQYDIIYSSDILEDCIDYINTSILANKFNL